MSGNLKTTKLLIEKGANLDLVDEVRKCILTKTYTTTNACVLRRVLLIVLHINAPTLAVF